MMPLKHFFAGLVCFLPLWVHAKCDQLSIHADKSYVCGSGLFRFYIDGASDAHSIDWDFGKGIRTGSDTIFEYFNAPDFINVKVKIHWKDGSSCIKSFLKIAEVKNLPSAAFSVSRKMLCDGPDTVLFRSLDSDIERFSWIIDGTNYFNNGSEIIHHFTSTGLKSLTLIVHDSFGCRGITESKHVVAVHPDVEVSISGDKHTGCAPQKANFKPVLNANGQNITQYSWTFNGGIPSQVNQQSANDISYGNAGQFKVNLKVTTEQGCIHEADFDNFVQIGDSVPIQLGFIKPYYCANDLIQIRDVYSKVGGTYTWSLPSGAVDINTTIDAARSFRMPKAGVHPFSITYEKNGCITRKTFDSALLVHDVTAEFSSNNNFHCTPPLSVEIKNNSKSTEGGNLTYYWTIRDEKGTVVRSSTRKDLSLYFSDWGYFDAELLVVHPNGCKDTLRQNSFIRIDTIRPQFSAEPSIACLNQSIQFKNHTLTSTFAGQDTFYWVFYDKNGKDVLGTSRERNPKFSYADTGFYPVALFAGNPSGCERKLLIPKAIEIIKPILLPVAGPEAICRGKLVQLKQQTLPAHAPFIHHWQLVEKTGKNTMSFASKDTSVVMKTIGRYDVVYSIQIGDGCRDTALISPAFSVNGIDLNITLNENSGCLPFDVSAKSLILINQYDGAKNEDTLRYTWKLNSSAGSSMNQIAPDQVETIFSSKGIFSYQLDVVNQAGCTNTIRSEQIFAGVDALTSLAKNKVCTGDPVRIESVSKLRPTSFHWFSPQNNLRIEGPGLPSTQLIPDIEGMYTLYFVTGKNNECFDTAKYVFEAIKVEARFHSLDTELTCAPVYAQFRSSSKNADELIWDFGDGETYITKLPDAAHVYFQNSGWDRGFDVSLIAKSKVGCSDTLKKEGYVWVKGPVPSANLTNLSGCEPLTVQVVDQSRDAIRYLVEYGDNRVYEGNTPATFLDYKISHQSLDTQFFEPVFYIYDSLGCMAKYDPDTVVMVKRTPVIDWYVSADTGCAPFDLKYSEKGKNVLSRKWSLSLPQGLIEHDQKAAQEQFAAPGLYPLALYVLNEQECDARKDTIVRVFPTPIARFALLDSICFQKEHLFRSEATVVGDVLSSLVWSLKNNNDVTDVYSGKDWNRVFAESGDFQLTHRVMTNHGCSDSVSLNLHVPHPNEIPAPSIQVVTVNDQQSIDVHANQNDYYRADGISLRNNNQLIKHTNDLSNWSFTNLPFSDVSRVQCYDLSLNDICDYQGPFGSAHCIVRLTVSSNQAFTASLSWSPYIGWTDVKAYRIYRSSQNTPEVLIAEVSGATLQYLDSPLCNQLYTYRIAALHPSEAFESWSNKASVLPLYQTSDVRINIRSIRVAENNSSLEIRWDPFKSDRFEQYVISKWRVQDDGSRIPVGTFTSDVSSITDTDVLPESERYVYSVAERDVCGMPNASGLEGVSILLDGSYDDYKSYLNWTLYGQWSAGISKQILQIRHPQRGFISAEELTESHSSTIDGKVWSEIQEDYCYRILAVSNELLPDTSSSNVVCLSGTSQIHIPNAFRPNNDGRNDVFQPIAVFGYNQTDNSFKMYRFSVFSRWGEKLFETNRIEEGWDGTYMGQPANGGVYMYQVRFFGLDHKIHMKEGTVLLLR